MPKNIGGIVFETRALKDLVPGLFGISTSCLWLTWHAQVLKSGGATPSTSDTFKLPSSNNQDIKPKQEGLCNDFPRLRLDASYQPAKGP